MQVSSWATAASVLVMLHMLVNPQHPHACETGRVIRCGLQAEGVGSFVYEVQSSITKESAQQ